MLIKNANNWQFLTLMVRPRYCAPFFHDIIPEHIEVTRISGQDVWDELFHYIHMYFCRKFWKKKKKKEFTKSGRIRISRTLERKSFNSLKFKTFTYRMSTILRTFLKVIAAILCSKKKLAYYLHSNAVLKSCRCLRLLSLRSVFSLLALLAWMADGSIIDQLFLFSSAANVSFNKQAF